jgi:hypothetical protein
MYATADESQPAMRAYFNMRFFGFPVRIAAAAIVLAGFCGACAAQTQTAQAPAAQAPAAKDATPPDPPAPNAFRAVTDFMGLTTEHADAPDFVRASRPDEEKMDYSHLTGVDKKRAPVKSAAEVEADKAALIAVRGKTDERRKRLEGEKMAPVAPNRAAPPVEDKF